MCIGYLWALQCGFHLFTESGITVRLCQPGPVGRLFGQGRAELLDPPAGALVHAGVGGHLAVGVKHGGVVAAAEAAADRGERLVGELPRQVHRHLAGVGHERPPVAGQQGIAREAERLCGGVLDALHGAAELTAGG